MSTLDADIRLLTIPEAAEKLRVSRTSLYKILGSGKLVTVRVGGRRLVTETALAEYLRGQAD